MRTLTRAWRASFIYGSFGTREMLRRDELDAALVSVTED